MRNQTLSLLATAFLAATAAAQESADPYLPPTPERDAAGGCDGIKDGGFGFHTALEARPWWQVDLGAMHELGRVLIYNRCNTAAERAVGIALSTSRDGRSWVRRHEHAGEPFGGVSHGGPLTVALDAKLLGTALGRDLCLQDLVVPAVGDNASAVEHGQNRGECGGAERQAAHGG